MKTGSPARIIALLAALVLLMAACSSDSTSTSTSTAGGGSTSASESSSGSSGGALDVSADTAAEIEADDYYFSPATLTGTAGQALTLTVTNDGGATHTFTIDDQGVDEEIKPGESVDVSVTFPDSGSVRFYCRFHAGSGMEGQLTVA